MARVTTLIYTATGRKKPRTNSTGGGTGGGGVTTTQQISPLPFTNSQTFFRPTVVVDNTIQANFYANAQTFYSPVVLREAEISPSFYTNAQTFYAPKLNHRIVTGFHANTSTGFTPAVSANTLIVANKHTNAQTFFAPQLNRTIAAAFHTNAQTFFAPAVTTSGVLIYPNAHTNSQTFYSPQINQDVRAAFYTNTNGFFRPTVTNAALPGYALSTPGFVLTSSADAAPQFDVTLNADHYAGYYLRIQRSTDGVKRNDGSYLNQTMNASNNGVLHMITPSELAALAITSTDLGPSGYTNPAGSWFQQYRIEREDGALSAWVEFSGTVTAPVATWYSVNGVDKNSELTISFPYLTWSSLNEGAPQGVRSTGAKSGKGHWEQSIVAIGGANTSWRMGVVDAATPLGPSLFPSPGLNCPGCVLAINPTSAQIHRNGGSAAVTLPGGGGGRVGDIAACEFDPATNTVWYYYKRPGDSFSLIATITLTSQIPSVWHGYGAGCGSGDSGTANFGSTTFAMTPTSGHTGW